MTLTQLFTAIANAIRAKKGTSGTIVAEDFPDEIADINTGNLSDEEYEDANDDLDEILEGTEVAEEWYITDTRYLFQGGARTEIYDKLLAHCKNVTYCSNMYAQCQNLAIVDLSGFDTSKVTNMASMFNNFAGQVIGLNNWDVSKVTIMSNMFQYANFANNSLDISNWNLASLTSTGSMFFNCYSLNETTLNNILKALPTAVNHPTKTLASLSITQAQATICEGLSNWQACLDAGWTTGY